MSNRNRQRETDRAPAGSRNKSGAETGQFPAALSAVTGCCPRCSRTQEIVRRGDPVYYRNPTPPVGTTIGGMPRPGNANCFHG